MMYVEWADQPGLADGFASVRLALSGAAPLPPPVLRRLAEVGRDGVRGVRADRDRAGADLDADRRRARSPARSAARCPASSCELRDSGTPAATAARWPTTTPGEIVVRGPNLFSGYWPDGAEGPDADGWWPTGDVAYADDDGDLHLVDRRKELILVSGFNVYPAEVEGVLAGHPQVVEAAVIGRPDPQTGDETVLAYVVPRPGGELTEAELLEWAAGSLARFKLPAAVTFVGELPHSATGKVSKARLREARPTT